jgi:hypothetical protein
MIAKISDTKGEDCQTISVGDRKMAKKVFWENPYLCESEIRVAADTGRDVTIEETIFYAFCGGQESGGSFYALS